MGGRFPGARTLESDRALLRVGWVGVALAAAAGCYATSSRGSGHIIGGDADADADADGDTDADAPCAVVPTPWTVSTLEGSAAFGTNLVIDAMGVGHATFTRWGDETAYARHADGRWSIETAFPEGYPGTGIGVDAEGAVHFAGARFTGDPAQRAVVHITNRGGEWTAEEIGTGYAGLAFALGPDGTPVVAFGGPAGELLVSIRMDGTWEENVVDAQATSCCMNLAVAVDPGGARHVAYFLSQYDQELRYATDRSGDWATQTVGESDYGAAGGLPPFIAFDRAGRALIGYQAPGEVRIATVDQGVLLGEALHPLAPGVPELSALWIEPPNTVHVAGVTLVDGLPGLAYATDRSGVWQSTRVTEVEEFFSPPLLVIDPSASPWLLYTALSNGAQSVIAAVPDGAWCR